MTTAGIYSYHPKVEHPRSTFIQMESDGFQPPFFFGGSQVPVMLQKDIPLTEGYKMSGSGVKKMKCHDTYVEGRGKIILSKSNQYKR
jgi:hypothetical protein